MPRKKQWLIEGKLRWLEKGLYVHENYLHVRLEQGGVFYRKHIGRTDAPGVYKTALYHLKEKQKEILTGRFGIETQKKRVTIEQACNAYWRDEASKKPSAKAFKIYLDKIKARFGQNFVDTINFQHTADLREYLDSKGLKGSTVNRVHTCWTRMFNFLYEMKKVKQTGFKDIALPEYNPGTPIKSRPETHKVSEIRFRRRRVVTPTEFAKFLGMASDRVKDICFAAVLTTLRRNDLKRLNIGSIDERTGTAYGVQGKVDSEFEIPLASHIKQIIINKGLNWTNFRKEFEAARDKSGVPHFLFKDLRKSLPGILRQMRCDTKTISEILGHASETMTEIYIPPTDEEKQQAVERATKVFLDALISDGKSDGKAVNDGSLDSLKTATNQQDFGSVAQG